MKKIIFVHILTVFLASSLFVACESNTTGSRETDQEATAVPDTTAIQSSTDDATEPGDLVMQAYMTSQFQQQLGQVAASNAQAEAVRDLAQDILEGDAQSRARMEELASATQAQLPQGLDVQHSATIDSLTSLSQEEFDKAYLNEVIDKYQENIERLNNLVGEGNNNPMVRGMATDIIDTQQEYMRKAEALLEELS